MIRLAGLAAVWDARSATRACTRYLLRVTTRFEGPRTDAGLSLINAELLVLDTQVALFTHVLALELPQLSI